MRTTFPPIHAAAAAAALLQVLLLAVAPAPALAQTGADTTGRSVPPDHSVRPDVPVTAGPDTRAVFCLPLDLAYPGVPASHGGGACTPSSLPPVTCTPPLVLVSNSCVTPNTTTCSPPNILVNGVCQSPAQCLPPAVLNTATNACDCALPSVPDGSNGCRCPDVNANLVGTDCPCNDSAMQVLDGRCQCPSNMVLNADRECDCVVPDEVRVGDDCEPAESESEEDDCPDGATPYGGGQCCPAGRVVAGDQCCAAGQVAVNGQCPESEEDACQDGSTPYGDGQCCPAGNEVVGAHCLPPCGGDLERQPDTSCGCPAATPPMTLFPPNRCCPAGEDLVGGVCQAPPVCELPLVPVGGVCQCPADTPVLSEGHCCAEGQEWDSATSSCRERVAFSSVCGCDGGVGFIWPGAQPGHVGVPNLGPGDAVCGPLGTYENNLCIGSGLGVDYVIADGPNAGTSVSICEDSEGLLAPATCDVDCSCDSGNYATAYQFPDAVLCWLNAIDTGQTDECGPGVFDIYEILTGPSAGSATDFCEADGVTDTVYVNEDCEPRAACQIPQSDVYVGCDAGSGWGPGWGHRRQAGTVMPVPVCGVDSNVTTCPAGTVTWGIDEQHPNYSGWVTPNSSDVTSNHGWYDVCEAEMPETPVGGTFRHEVSEIWASNTLNAYCAPCGLWVVTTSICDVD